MVFVAPNVGNPSRVPYYYNRLLSLLFHEDIVFGSRKTQLGFYVYLGVFGDHKPKAQVITAHIGCGGGLPWRRHQCGRRFGDDGGVFEAKLWDVDSQTAY